MKKSYIVLLILLALAVYVFSNPHRMNRYNHFVWQAQAFLEGTALIPAGKFHDAMPAAERRGYALLPYPPLPAILLVPFVAMWGLKTNAALIAAFLGAINVGLCFRMLSLVSENRLAVFLGTIFYGFGTVAWYAAVVGSTWFFAHIVASTFLFLAITASFYENRFRAGFLLGLAALARLPTIFGAPFFFSFRSMAGAMIPIVCLLGYNLATSGHLFNPVYEYLYRTEYRPDKKLYREDWKMEDIRYLPQNLKIMFLQPPKLNPLKPDPLGMSILLTSPAYLLALFSFFKPRDKKLVIGATLAVLSIAFINLMHFSQGWVQFGYRFSNDFAPFALILVTLGIEKALKGKVTSWLAYGLVGASIVVNAWGVYWAVQLRW